MPLRKSCLPRLSSSPIKENAFTKQGIVTILRSDPEKPKSAPASIRRTLSADMSSKKWLELNGFSTLMKKIECFKEFPVNHSPDSSSESEEEDQNRRGRDDVWKSIVQQKEKNEIPKPNIWGSLIKTETCKSDLPPPYVHPLVKRSGSTLSEKSLEICTESLGSETGSDCFSPHQALELSDEEKEVGNKAFVHEERVKELNPFEDLQVKQYKVSPVRPFPPPMPSIAGGDGGSIHMHSRRENGRLVLEAVSVPSRNNFHAQRRDGRLVLTLLNAQDEVVEENEGEIINNMEEIDGNVEELDNKRDDGGYSEEEEKIETQNVVKEVEFVKSTRSSMISVHKTGLVMKKLVVQGNENPVWTKKAVDTVAADGKGMQIPQSLPPLPWVARIIPTPPSSGTVGSFNAYDYFWRKNTTPDSFIAATQSAEIKNNHYNNKTHGGSQDLVIIKEKEEKFSPYLRACKDGRRSLLIWEPYCIATS